MINVLSLLRPALHEADFEQPAPDHAAAASPAAQPLAAAASLSAATADARAKEQQAVRAFIAGHGPEHPFQSAQQLAHALVCKIGNAPAQLPAAAQEPLLVLARQLPSSCWPLTSAAAQLLAELHLERAQRAQQARATAALQPPPAEAAAAASANDKTPPRPAGAKRKQSPEAAMAAHLRAAERYLAVCTMNALLEDCTAGPGSQAHAEPDQAATGPRALRARQQWALGRAAEMRRDHSLAARRYAACRADVRGAAGGGAPGAVAAAGPLQREGR